MTATNIEYEETLNAPKPFVITVICFFGSLILFFLFYPFLTAEALSSGNLFLSLLFVIILWIVLVFCSLKVTLYSHELEFGFYMLTKRFNYVDILKCEAFQYQMRDYLGWAIRKSPDGSTMYNVIGDKNMAVKIVVREDNETKEYAFSAKRPEVIVKKINTHIHSDALQ